MHDENQAQTITIVGWLLASFLMMGLVSACSTRAFRLEPPERHALTQAYYYGIMAAALYFIVAMLMVFTVFGAWRGHYEKEFRLTMVQRTLMMQTIAFLVYLLIGAYIFSVIEGWQFLDAVYWADFTLLTVGIGDDFTPKTHSGRALLFPYAFGGILTVGLVIGSIRSLILERGKQKMEARMIEKKREKVLSTADLEKKRIKISMFHTIAFSQEGLTEPQRREQEFHIMRKIQDDSASNRKWTALGMSVLAAMTLWLVGAVIFMVAENKQNWSYFVSMYFAYTSLLTIGYGDLQPTSNSGKPFFVLWSLLAIPTLTVLISNMGDTVVKAISDLTNWAGSLTILPGENGAKATLRAGVKKVTSKNRMPAKKEFHTVVPGRAMPDEDAGGNEAKNDHDRTIEDHAMERLGKYMEESELSEAKEASDKGDLLQRDMHLYHYVLVRELRHLMRDVEASPPKQYSYNDWAWYLKLIGQDEANPDLHRKPPVKPSRHDPETESDDKEHVGQANGGDGDLSWSWLGTRSPLMGSKSESEWLLEKLSRTLERELYDLRSGSKRKNKRPPIGFEDFKRKQQGKKVAKNREESDTEKSSADKVEDKDTITKGLSHSSDSKGEGEESRSSTPKDEDEQVAKSLDKNERSMSWE